MSSSSMGAKFLLFAYQREEKVCVIRNTLLTHRTPEEVAQGTGNGEVGG